MADKSPFGAGRVTRSTTFPCEIHTISRGKRISFIQNEYTPDLGNMKSIPVSVAREARPLSPRVRALVVFATSRVTVRFPTTNSADEAEARGNKTNQKITDRKINIVVNNQTGIFFVVRCDISDIQKKGDYSRRALSPAIYEAIAASAHSKPIKKIFPRVCKLRAAIPATRATPQYNKTATCCGTPA